MSNASPMLNPRSQFPGFRYWPYEQISWRQTIAKSGLPDDVQKLITSVIKKSRLMRFEKVEVVGELVDHFVDGKAAGKSYSQLIAKFGDVTTTASLIRNSKIRNRPIMFKIMQIAGWGFFALASAYLGLWGYFQSGHPTPTTDYMPAFNQFADNLDEDETAWPIYRPAWAKFGFCEGGEFSSKMKIFYVAEGGVDEYGRDNTRRITPNDPTWQQATAQLEQWSELLHTFRAAASKPRMGLKLQPRESNYSAEDYAALFPNSTETKDHSYIETMALESTPELANLIDGSLVGILLPHVQSFRAAARLLHFDNLHAIEQGDSQRVTENLIAHFSLARHAADCNCLVGGLVGIAVANLAFEEIDEMVTINGFLDEDQLHQIQSAVESFKVRDLVQFDGERALANDLIQRIYTDDGNGDGRVTPAGIRMLESVIGMRNEKWSKAYPEFAAIADAAQHLTEPVAVFRTPGRKETIERYQAILDLIEEDFDRPAWQANMHDFTDSGLRGQFGQYSPLNYLLPANNQIQDRMYFTIGVQEATVLALAAHRFNRANDSWPASMEQLTADFLTEIPVDVFSGGHLKFVIRDNMPIVYSVWKDGDDDGGAAPFYQHQLDDGSFQPLRSANDHAYSHYGKISTSKYEGDLILWPMSAKDGQISISLKAARQSNQPTQ